MVEQYLKGIELGSIPKIKLAIVIHYLCDVFEGREKVVVGDGSPRLKVPRVVVPHL